MSNLPASKSKDGEPFHINLQNNLKVYILHIITNLRAFGIKMRETAGLNKKDCYACPRQVKRLRVVK